MIRPQRQGRMDMRVTCRALVLVAAAALLVGASAAQATIRALPVLRVGLSLDITSLDPTKYATSAGIAPEFGDLAYDGLFHAAPNGKVVPQLATKWRYLTTGRGPNKDFELTLRHNARFSDGTRLTAAAVV